LMQAGTSNASHPLSFAYVGSRRLEDVLARIEFMVRVRGARVVAVDYLQSIVPRGSFHSRREAIDSVLAELISLCGRLGVALILASQLARPDKGSPYREPNLIDLKESGEIENRAQCVVMLWRDSDEPGAVVHGKIAKAKRQPAGARFDLVRDPDTGMLIEKPEYWGRS
jgi:replicative DNA helicase